MNVTLVEATTGERQLLERMLQLYEYDYSEYATHDVDLDESGRFPTVDTDAIWRPGYHVFLARVDGRTAGFAFVTRHRSLIGEGEVNVIDEFFVLRRYRRRGVGEQLARLVFDRFPGRWEVNQLTSNVAGQAFWRRVIGRYTGGTFDEFSLDDERWRGPVQTFESPTAALLERSTP